MTNVMSRDGRWIQHVRIRHCDPVDMGHKETTPFRDEHPEHFPNQRKAFLSCTANDRRENLKWLSIT